MTPRPRDRGAPDDEVLGMGGTIAVHADAGDAVRVLVVTDGSSTPVPGRRRDARAQGGGGAARRGGARGDRLRPPRPPGHAPRHARARRREPGGRGARPRARAAGRSTRVQPDVNRDHRVLFDSVAVATRPVPGQPVRRAPHVRADLEHRVDAGPGELVRPELVRRRDARRSSARSRPSPTTRPSGGSFRTRAASARSARPPRTTARAAAGSTREPFVLVRGLDRAVTGRATVGPSCPRR